jgi:hypothetical protein
LSTTTPGGGLSVTFASNILQPLHDFGTLTVENQLYNIGDQISTVGAATPFYYDPVQGDLLVQWDLISLVTPSQIDCYMGTEYSNPYPVGSD